MSPHLALLDGVHHLFAEHAVGESGIVNGDRPADDHREREDCDGNECSGQQFAKEPGIIVAIEANDAAHRAGSMPHINDVVTFSQQAIQISCYLGARLVFERHCEVSRRLPVEETEFAELHMTEAAQAALRAVRQLVQMFPVFAPLLNPGD